MDLLYYDISFAHINFLWILLIIPILVILYVLKNNKINPEISISDTKRFKETGKSKKIYFLHVNFILRILALAFLIVAFARPQTSSSKTEVTTEGIDIVLSMDISSSMLAKDFTPNRMEAAKNVAKEFILGRPSDRIGLVVFSGESFTQCPITTDHAVLINLISDIRHGMLSDGTAIGMGLATSINRLKNSKAKSKVIILLTDGVNNVGSITPKSAAEFAKKYNIRIYTIGVGTRGKAYTPVALYPNGEFAYSYVDVNIDENTLKYIANSSDGKYFRATNNASLKSIYSEIDKLEKSKIEVLEFKNKTELFYLFAIMAALVLLVEFLLKYTVFKSIP